MKKQISFVLLLLLLALCLQGCSANKSLRLGTGGEGGNYHGVGLAMAERMDGVLPQKITVRTTAGSAANLRLMRENILDLAIVQSDVLLDAQQGKGIFAETYADCGAVAVLYDEACQIVVPANSDITSVADFYNRTVAIGQQESGVLRNARDVLAAYGLNDTRVNARYLSFAESAEALRNGEIDGFFVTGGTPTKAVAELAETMEIRLLSLDERTLTQLCRQDAGYDRFTIPAGTYAGQTEDVTTVAVKAVLAAHSRVPDETVDALLKTLQEDGYLPAAADVSLTYHKGAAPFYAEYGISVPTQNGAKPAPYRPAAGQDG